MPDCRFQISAKTAKAKRRNVIDRPDAKDARKGKNGNRGKTGKDAKGKGRRMTQPCRMSWRAAAKVETAS